ncbi:glycosyltransferase [Demequina sp. NBRC 110052]|uniref:glycosyltransferase n=1 Tax=Demequina sp. NBRC 110052 TaxID=1570341 RepID=UPI00135672DE|nr:glycosyltransferase [Demequina sp. NBRC 110052]
MVRLLNASAARRTAHLLRHSQIVHFEEGLGHALLSRNPGVAGVMERRNLHHADFERPLEPISDFPYRVFRDPLREVYNYEYEQSSAVLAYSQVQLESLVRNGVDREKVSVVPIPIAATHRSEGMVRERGVALYVGRVTADKGIDVAVAAARRSASVERLVVAGPIPNPSVGAWLRAQPKVDYVGVAGRAELEHLFATSTFMLAPSMESFGLAVLEAASHGLHVLARETTGAAEYLPRQARTVVAGRNPVEWADAIDRWTADGADLASSPRLDADHESALRMLSAGQVEAALAAVYSRVLERCEGSR